MLRHGANYDDRVHATCRVGGRPQGEPSVMAAERRELAIASAGEQGEGVDHVVKVVGELGELAALRWESSDVTGRDDGDSGEMASRSEGHLSRGVRLERQTGWTRSGRRSERVRRPRRTPGKGGGD